ncbi:MAG: NUDIX hydrolase, partial [Deltaproteobacteria bacterium]|nr:NUDIX hydrolase [Deltaproteobacteria bacterium]
MKAKNQHDGVILAAGGVVEKHTDQGLTIAVIYRRRYGGEWNLPKGKLMEHESPWQAATREVEEETGCRVHITGFAGSTNYYHNGIPKVVLYWRMEAEGECAFQPSEEVEKLEWLLPREALERLSHAEEKNLVSHVYYGRELPRRDHMWSTLRALWGRVFRFSQYDRLANALFQYRVELEWRIRRAGEHANPDSWAEAARKYVSEAEGALKQFNVDRGWQCLQAAQSIEVWGYNTQELNHRATILRQEVSKLNDWRRRTTLELLGQPDNKAGEVKAAEDDGKGRVYRAAVLRDEYFNNLYFKIGVRGGNLRILFAILTATVVSLPILAGFGMTPKVIGDYRTLIAVELFGVLGASFSVAITLTKGSLEATIP